MEAEWVLSDLGGLASGEGVEKEGLASRMAAAATTSMLSGFSEWLTMLRSIRVASYQFGSHTSQDRLVAGWQGWSGGGGSGAKAACAIHGAPWPVCKLT